MRGKLRPSRIKKETEISLLYAEHGEEYFYRNGRMPTRLEKTILAELKRKDEDERARKRYIRNPDPGKPIALNNPINPNYNQGMILKRQTEILPNVVTRGTVGGIFKERAINGTARNMTIHAS